MAKPPRIIEPINADLKEVAKAIVKIKDSKHVDKKEPVDKKKEN